MQLSTVVIYARDMKKTAAFYQNLFGFQTSGEIFEGLIELSPPDGGARILIHQAAKSVKLGQVGIKLSFAVRDVEEFKEIAAGLGVKFGPIHQANGYVYMNAKDPDKNSVSVSNRDFRFLR